MRVQTPGPGGLGIAPQRMLYLLRLSSGRVHASNLRQPAPIFEECQFCAHLIRFRVIPAYRRSLIPFHPPIQALYRNPILLPGPTWNLFLRQDPCRACEAITPGCDP